MHSVRKQYRNAWDIRYKNSSTPSRWSVCVLRKLRIPQRIDFFSTVWYMWHMNQVRSLYDFSTCDSITPHKLPEYWLQQCDCVNMNMMLQLTATKIWLHTLMTMYCTCVFRLPSRLNFFWQIVNQVGYLPGLENGFEKNLAF